MLYTNPFNKISIIVVTYINNIVNDVIAIELESINRKKLHRKDPS